MSDAYPQGKLTFDEPRGNLSLVSESSVTRCASCVHCDPLPVKSFLVIHFHQLAPTIADVPAAMVVLDTLNGCVRSDLATFDDA